MGQTAEGRYTAVLREMVRDPDALVRFNALRSMRRINLAGGAKAASENDPNSGTQDDSSGLVANKGS
jgi:hypothetical protein